MDQLDDASVEWALLHVSRFGICNLLPSPFELSVLAGSWKELKAWLLSVDLSSHRTLATRRVLAPKSSLHFRVATLLDLRDALLLTAAVRQCAEHIERARIPEDQRVICSFRGPPTPEGSFFRGDDGWPTFQAETQKLIESGQFSFVVHADISDFFGNIYLHRVQSALETAGVSETRSKSIERLLLGLTAKQSRGLPIGPTLSNVLAEACLDDVDKWLRKESVTFLRYVDDFRIFVDSERSATTTLHNLAGYLSTSHRLTLQEKKTRLFRTSELKQKLEDPSAIEEAKQRETLWGIATRTSEDIGYVVLPDDLPEVAGTEATKRALKQILKSGLARGDLRLGLVKHALRRMAHLRIRDPLEIVLRHMDQLAPAMPDVCHYLAAVLPKKKANKATAKVSMAIKECLQSGRVGGLPFVLEWVLWLASEVPGVLTLAEAESVVARFPGLESRIRSLALIARNERAVGWFRAHKETWKSLGPWDQRAVVWGASVLARTERRKWLEEVKESTDDVLLAAVVRAAMN